MDEPLAQHVRHAIEAAGGWIGFDVFMQQALYTPGYGYYCGGGQPFAKDFVTAPMLGPWFGQAIWNCSRALRQPPVFRIREFGGGRGDLAACLMACANADPHQEKAASSCAAGGDSMAKGEGIALEMQMVELSADLMQQQAQATKGLGSIAWLSQWEPDFCGLVLANEMLDAMPVKVFEWTGGAEVREWGVGVANQQLIWLDRPASPELTHVVLARERGARQRDLPWAQGYRGEWCPWTFPWLQGLHASMASGAVLLVDYGFSEQELDHPGRTRGTLCAHFRHQRIDDSQEMLARLGQQDLTAHVNFSQIAREAVQAGFQVRGFVTQARFLMNAGVLDQAAFVIQATHDPIARAKQLQSLQMLMLESEMGEVFKVMLLTKGLSPTQVQAMMDCGFQASDRLESLWS